MNVKTQIEKFNSDNLTSAIETCYEKPFYRVLIVAPKMVRTTGLIVIDCVSKLYNVSARKPMVFRPWDEWRQF